MEQLVVVDAFFLLDYYHDLFRQPYKIFIPRSVEQRIRNKAIVNIETIGCPTDDEERKRHFKLYRNHHIMGFFNDSKDKYEVIGSAGSGWVQKIRPLADLFQEEKNLSFFEDQMRIAAALLYLQEGHPSSKIIFLFKDDTLKEFVEAVFAEFLPDNFLECYSGEEKFVEDLFGKTKRSLRKTQKKKFEEVA